MLLPLRRPRRINGTLNQAAKPPGHEGRCRHRRSAGAGGGGARPSTLPSGEQLRGRHRGRCNPRLGGVGERARRPAAVVCAHARGRKSRPPPLAATVAACGARSRHRRAGVASHALGGPAGHGANERWWPAAPSEAGPPRWPAGGGGARRRRRGRPRQPTRRGRRRTRLAARSVARWVCTGGATARGRPRVSPSATITAVETPARAPTGVPASAGATGRCQRPRCRYACAAPTWLRLRDGRGGDSAPQLACNGRPRALPSGTRILFDSRGSRRGHRDWRRRRAKTPAAGGL